MSEVVRRLIEDGLALQDVINELAAEEVRFFVNGKPEPQGSARAFMAGGRPVITSANKNLKDWRTIMAVTAAEHALMYEGAVEVHLKFDMPRPVSLPKKVVHNIKRPDIDKLARAALDALTGIFFKDDSQVITLIVRKGYADPFPGVHVTVRPAR